MLGWDAVYIGGLAVFSGLYETAPAVHWVGMNGLQEYIRFVPTANFLGIVLYKHFAKHFKTFCNESSKGD